MRNTALATVLSAAASVGMVEKASAGIIEVQIEGIVITGGLTGGESSFDNGDVGIYTLLFDTSVMDSAGSPAVGFYLDTVTFGSGIQDGQSISFADGDSSIIYSTGHSDVFSTAFTASNIISNYLDTNGYGVEGFSFGFLNGNPDADPLTSDSLIEALRQDSLDSFSMPQMLFNFDDPDQTQVLQITNATIVPGPGALALGGVALAGMGAFRRRKDEGPSLG